MNRSQIRECGNWETEHYNSGNNKAAQIHFWEHINRNQTFILDSHRLFICSTDPLTACCTWRSRIWNEVILKFSVIIMGIFAYMQLYTQDWCKTGFQWHLITLTMMWARSWRCVPDRCIPNESFWRCVPWTRVFERWIITTAALELPRVPCGPPGDPMQALLTYTDTWTPPVRDGSYGDKLTFYHVSCPSSNPSPGIFPTHIYDGGVGGEACNHTVILYCIVYILESFKIWQFQS